MWITFFILLIYIMVIFIEISIISLKLTGLPMDKARFQVISLLTSTGFTTKESELITQHPVRRKIAERIMIFKYFGGIVGTATLFNIYTTWVMKKIEMIDIVIWIVLLTIIFAVIKSNWILSQVDYFIEIQLTRQSERNKARIDSENLWVRNDFGIVDVVLDENSYLVGTRLKDSNLKKSYIQILQIDKGDRHYPFPKPEITFSVGDKLTIYGNLNNIKELIMNSIENEQKGENVS